MPALSSDSSRLITWTQDDHELFKPYLAKFQGYLKFKAGQGGNVGEEDWSLNGTSTRACKALEEKLGEDIVAGFPSLQAVECHLIPSLFKR